MLKSSLENVSLLATFLGLAACAAAPASTGSNHGVGGSGSNGGDGSNGGSGYVPPGTGGAQGMDPDSGMVCDNTGKCTCINIAEFGKTGTFGAVQGQDGTTAFQQWLNSKSTAKVDVYDTRTTITPDLLAKYQVMILQDLTNVVAYSQQSDYWTYSADEVAAVSDWVQNKGGSIISLTGYFSDNSYEINPTNQLLAFSGISYNGDDIMGAADCPIDPVKNQQLCWCWGGSVPITAWNTSEQMTQEIREIGAFRGRSINAPSGASVFATFNGKNVAVGMKVGAGRVFAFADEWVTYNSQWNDSSLSQPASNYEDPNNPCYGRKPSQEYQIPQFWFNSISWCQPVVAKCFTINEPTVTPVIIN
jgi:hypothetical protein